MARLQTSHDDDVKMVRHTGYNGVKPLPHVLLEPVELLGEHVQDRLARPVTVPFVWEDDEACVAAESFERVKEAL